MRQFFRIVVCPLAVTILLSSLVGCGGYDSSPEQFQQGVTDQYDLLIEKVKQNSALSDEQKVYEIAKLEKQRQDFAAYAGGEQNQ